MQGSPGVRNLMVEGRFRPGATARLRGATGRRNSHMGGEEKLA